MEPNVLQQIPDEYKEIYQRHWKTIKPSVKQGRIRCMYHWPLVAEDTHNEIKTHLHEVLNNHDKIKARGQIFQFFKNFMVRAPHRCGCTQLLRLCQLTSWAEK